jgi:hypothetical protein
VQQPAHGPGQLRRREGHLLCRRPSSLSKQLDQPGPGPERPPAPCWRAPVGGDGLRGDHLLADARLDGHPEHLAGDELLELARQRLAHLHQGRNGVGGWGGGGSAVSTGPVGGGARRAAQRRRRCRWLLAAHWQRPPGASGPGGGEPPSARPCRRAHLEGAVAVHDDGQRVRQLAVDLDLQLDQVVDPAGEWRWRGTRLQVSRLCRSAASRRREGLPSAWQSWRLMPRYRRLCCGGRWHLGRARGLAQPPRRHAALPAARQQDAAPGGYPQAGQSSMAPGRPGVGESATSARAGDCGTSRLWRAGLAAGQPWPVTDLCSHAQWGRPKQGEHSGMQQAAATDQQSTRPPARAGAAARMPQPAPAPTLAAQPRKPRLAPPPPHTHTPVPVDLVLHGRVAL